MIELNQKPDISEIAYCTEKETKRDIEIEIMFFKDGVELGEHTFMTIIKTEYTDDNTPHGMELFKIYLNNAQVAEAIKVITENPEKFKR